MLWRDSTAEYILVNWSVRVRLPAKDRPVHFIPVPAYYHACRNVTGFSFKEKPYRDFQPPPPLAPFTVGRRIEPHKSLSSPQNMYSSWTGEGAALGSTRFNRSTNEFLEDLSFPRTKVSPSGPSSCKAPILPGYRCALFPIGRAICREIYSGLGESRLRVVDEGVR